MCSCNIHERLKMKVILKRGPNPTLNGMLMNSISLLIVPLQFREETNPETLWKFTLLFCYKGELKSWLVNICIALFEVLKMFPEELRTMTVSLLKFEIENFNKFKSQIWGNYI